MGFGGGGKGSREGEGREYNDRGGRRERADGGAWAGQERGLGGSR